MIAIGATTRSLSARSRATLISCSRRCRIRWQRRGRAKEEAGKSRGGTLRVLSAGNARSCVGRKGQAERAIKGEGAEVTKASQKAVAALHRRADMMEEGSTAEGYTAEGSTAAAGMAITTIKLGARPADRLLACIVKEEGIIMEEGSTVVGIKGEG